WYFKLSVKIKTINAISVIVPCFIAYYLLQKVRFGSLFVSTLILRAITKFPCQEDDVIVTAGFS
ncbi:hypothetical protein BDP81DRAFT_66209, partial [Colletotrichum phormii]